MTCVLTVKQMCEVPYLLTSSNILPLREYQTSTLTHFSRYHSVNTTRPRFDIFRTDLTLVKEVYSAATVLFLYYMF